LAINLGILKEKAGSLSVGHPRIAQLVSPGSASAQEHDIKCSFCLVLHLENVNRRFFPSLWGQVLTPNEHELNQFQPWQQTRDLVSFLSLGPSFPEPRFYFKLGKRSLVLIMCLSELLITFKLKAFMGIF
jgi:hypothetical protein